MPYTAPEVRDGILTICLAEGLETPEPLTDDAGNNFFDGISFTPEQVQAIEQAVEEAYHLGYYTGKNEVRLEMKQAFSNFFNTHF